MNIPNKRGLGVAALFLSGMIFIAPAARADQAPRGKFLPNDPYEVPRTRYQELMDLSSFLPPPDKIQFETRMIWLEAAMARYRPSFSWLGGKDATQMRFAAALRDEMEYIQNLGPEQKGPYYLAMMRDLGTLELADLDATWLWQVSGAALVDLLTGAATAGTMEVGGRAKKWLENYATNPDFVWEAPPDILEEIFGPSASGATSAYAGTFTGGGSLGNPYARMRLKALKTFLLSHCGCIPRVPGLAPTLGWDGGLPQVRGTYQTRVGRILGTITKSTAGIDDIRNFVELRPKMVRDELASADKLAKKNPDYLGAFLANLAFDIETLHAELLEDVRQGSDLDTVAGFAQSAIADVSAAAFLAIASGPGAPALLPTAVSLALSALYTGLSEWGSFSTERQLLIQITALRNVVLDRLAALPPGNCGCEKQEETYVLLYTRWPGSANKAFKKLLVQLVKDRNDDGKVDDDEADWGNVHGFDGTVELLTLPEAMERMTAEKIKDHPVLDYLIQKHIFGFDESDRKAAEDAAGKKDKEMTRDDFVGNAYGAGGWTAALILRDPEQALARIREFGLKSLSTMTDLKTKDRTEALKNACRELDGAFASSYGKITFDRSRNWILVDFACSR